MPDLTPEEFRRLGHEVVDWVAGYRERLEDLPVRSEAEPGWVRGSLPDELPEHPQPLSALLADMDEIVVPGTTHWQHPSFFGYFPANASLASLLGELLSSGLGVQGMLWSTSPAATELEQHLLDQLAVASGLGEAFTFGGGGGGVIQDSASSAALAALLAALHRGSSGWRESGTDGLETAYVSPETHSSLAKAVRIAGLGADALRVVGTEPGTTAMSADALSATLATDVGSGRKPVLVCATVGTTGTGACDPVRSIASACVEHGAWLHVDAAWAGAAALCPELRGPFDGIELADSYCADAHKWLLTAFDASILWTRHGTALPDALSVTPEYLRNAATESGEVVDFRDWHVPLGRRFRALKLWAVLRCLGMEGVREHVRSHVAWAAELAQWVRADPGFELAAEPSLALVCLRVRTGRGPQADDEASRAVLERVNASGAAMLTHTRVAGRYLVRVAIGSVGTQRRHVVALWDLVRATAAEVTTSPAATGSPGDTDQPLLDHGDDQVRVPGEEAPGRQPPGPRGRR
ncbi:MAG: aspartate aminotransferase family protein [Pseudonocardiaceae bacterium]|nr:aspartate aminotransferase family protein [Pseudonocardiaceae bacterium]